MQSGCLSYKNSHTMCTPPGVWRLKTCCWLNNMFILCAIRNTYSVGTWRIGYSLASDQVINMQRIITKWCVVQQNCVKYIMNWYSWCLLANILPISKLWSKHSHFILYNSFGVEIFKLDFVSEEIWLYLWIDL